MTEEGFRLPGSTYEELVNVIVAYGTRDEAANPGDVSKLNAVHQSSVSRSNAFLRTIGVLSGEQEKLVTSRGRALAQALERKAPEEIRRNWRELVSASAFLQNVVSAVKLREGIPPATLQSYIAHTAGQPLNKPVMTGTGAIIEILKAADLLRKEGGQLVATLNERQEATPEPAGEALPNPEISTSRPAEVSVSAAPLLNGGPQVNIHIQVRCTPDQIEDLAPKLKALLKELSGRTGFS